MYVWNLLAELAEITGGPVMTGVADAHALCAGRVVVAATVSAAVCASPAEVTLAGVLGGTHTVAVNALLITSAINRKHI